MMGNYKKTGLSTSLSVTEAHVNLEPFTEGGDIPRLVRRLTVLIEVSSISGVSQLTGRLSSQSTGQDTLVPNFTMTITTDATATNGKCAAVLEGPWAMRKVNDGTDEELTLSLTCDGGTCTLDEVHLVVDNGR